MALTDDTRYAQDVLNDLWSGVQDQKELAKNEADLELYSSVHILIDDAQQALDHALQLLGQAA